MSTNYLGVHKRGQNGVFNIRLRGSEKLLNREVKSLLTNSEVTFVDVKNEQGEIIKRFSSASQKTDGAIAS